MLQMLGYGLPVAELKVAVQNKRGARGPVVTILKQITVKL
jgi:hypothetical protein